jgi:hypothetical protein
MGGDSATQYLWQVVKKQKYLKYAELKKLLDMQGK